jgi:hypothetical protein
VKENLNKIEQSDWYLSPILEGENLEAAFELALSLPMGGIIKLEFDLLNRIVKDTQGRLCRNREANDPWTGA